MIQNMHCYRNANKYFVGNNKLECEFPPQRLKNLLSCVCSG